MEYQSRLDKLLQAHYHLVEAGKLSKSARPYSVQATLQRIHALIMEELDKPQDQPTQPNDDIPF